jgi:hypothetical protein
MANMQLTKQTLDVRTLGGLYGSAFIAGAGGVVAQGTTTQVFLDPLGGAANSGIPQTFCTSNFFNGRAESGEIITAFGMQAMVYETTNAHVAVASTAAIQAAGIRNLSYTLQLKGSTYPITGLATLPCPLGSNTSFQNGGRGVAPFRFPRQLPLQIEGTQQFAVTIRAEHPIATGGGTNGFRIFLYLPASKGIPLGQLSGA